MWQLVKEKENPEFKPVFTAKKLTLCHILLVVEGLDRYKYRTVLETPAPDLEFRIDFFQDWFPQCKVREASLPSFCTNV